MNPRENPREPYYPDRAPVPTGLAGKCPRCGHGKLFAGYLKLAEQCSNCKLDFRFADAGDGAAWFVMLVSSVIAVGTALFVEVNWQPSYWVHAAIAVPLAIGIPLLLLRPAKGSLICQQYVTKAQESRHNS